MLRTGSPLWHGFAVSARSPPRRKRRGQPAARGGFVRYATHPGYALADARLRSGLPPTWRGTAEASPPTIVRLGAVAALPYSRSLPHKKPRSRCGRCAPLLDARFLSGSRRPPTAALPRNTNTNSRASRNTGLPFYRTRNTQSVLHARRCAVALQSKIPAPADSRDGYPHSPAHERRRPRRIHGRIAGEGRAWIKKRCTHSAICAINAKAPLLRGLRQTRDVEFLVWKWCEFEQRHTRDSIIANAQI